MNHSPQESPVRLNSSIMKKKTFEWKAENHRRKQEAPFSFSCLRGGGLIITQAAPLRPKHTSPQASTVQTSRVSSKRAPPHCSDWLFHSLSPLYIPPSFSPPLSSAFLSFPFITSRSHWPLHSQRIPLVLSLTQLSTRTLLSSKKK